MVDLLEGFSVWLHVVMEDQLVDRTFQYDKDYSESALNNSGTEHVPLSKDGNSDLILKVSDAQKLLSGEGLNDLLVNSLLEVSDVLLMVFEHRWQIGIIAAHPLGLPLEEHAFDHGCDVGMNILKMKRICSVFRDILHVTHDVVLRLPSVL